MTVTIYLPGKSDGFQKLSIGRRRHDLLERFKRVFLPYIDGVVVETRKNVVRNRHKLNLNITCFIVQNFCFNKKKTTHQFKPTLRLDV